MPLDVSSSSLARFSLLEVRLVPNKDRSFSLDPGRKTHRTGGSLLPSAATCGINKKGIFVVISHRGVLFCFVIATKLTNTGIYELIVHCIAVHGGR